MKLGLSEGPTVFEFDLTGLNPNPEIVFSRTRPVDGHGNTVVDRGYGEVRFDCSVLGANDNAPKNVPGSMGSVRIKLGEADIRKLRDQLDIIVGLADEVNDG